MTRKKVTLAFITNDSARKATYKKRKRGLLKKVSELSTLCGVDACAVIYSPYASQPEVWPSPEGAERVLSEFRKMPEMEQSKKMVNQESFLRQRIVKAQEQLKKVRKDNREKEITRVMFQCLTGKSLTGMNVVDLNEMGWLIDQFLNDVHKKIESLAVADDPQKAKKPEAETVQAEVATQEQQQSWVADLVNSQEQDQIGFATDDMVLPFGDRNHYALWSNAFNS